MGVQALRPELAVERFGERVGGRLAGAAEAEDHATCVGPQVKTTGDEFTALIDPDLRRIANLATDAVQDLDHVWRPEAEPRHDC